MHHFIAPLTPHLVNSCSNDRIGPIGRIFPRPVLGVGGSESASLYRERQIAISPRTTCHRTSPLSPPPPPATPTSRQTPPHPHALSAAANSPRP